MVDYRQDIDELDVYVIDFGMAEKFNQKRIHGMTIDFTPYETLLGTSHEDTIEKLDIFSIGAVMFNFYFKTSFLNYFLKITTNEKKNDDGKFLILYLII